MKKEKKPRRTQKERSAHTRECLIEATLDCLQQVGYHGTSLSRILEKAGVSRGAWRHHFENKMELVAASAECILEQAISLTRQMVTDAAPENLSLESLFDFIWNRFYTGRHRDVWLEFNVACRTDKELRERLIPVLRHFHASMSRAWKMYFTAKNSSDFQIETLMLLSINAMRGMAIQSVGQPDPEYYRHQRSEWIRLIRPFIEIRPEALKEEEL